MPTLRRAGSRIGTLADTLLKSHLQQKAQQQQMEEQYALQRQNQDAASKQSSQGSMLTAALGDQSGGIFDKLKQAGITTLNGQDISGMAPTMDDATGGVSSEIQKDPTKWDPLSIINAVKAAPGGQIDPNAREPIANLITQRNQAMELKRNSGPVQSRDFIDPSGKKMQEYVNPLNASPVQAEQTGAQKGTDAMDEQLSNELSPTRMSMETLLAGDKARAVSDAQFPNEKKLIDARAAADWTPDILKRKLDFETQKMMTEASMAGMKVEAEAVATRNRAVTQLLPLYSNYKDLVKTVKTFAGNQFQQTEHKVLGKLPWIGGAAASGMENLASLQASIINPPMAKKIDDLNVVTDALAQGMANAILGNRGQTSENDRNAAKSLLVGVFTTQGHAEDMLAVTDKMFTLLPRVVAQNPADTVPMVLEKLKAEAEKPDAAPQMDDPNAAALSKLDELRKGGANAR